MSLKLGTTDINGIKLGSTTINKAYLGSTLVYGSDGEAASNGLLNNLISYYDCDTNGTFLDLHGSNDGTISGASYTASGYLNGAYSFDGSNDYVNLGSLISTGSSYSLAMPIYRTTGASNNWEHLLDASSGRAIFYTRTDTPGPGNLVAYYDSSTWVNWGYTCPLNTWVYAVFVINGTSADLYINGVKQGTTQTVTSNSLGGAITLASRTSGIGATQNFFAGRLDEIGIWNKALTADDVTTLYNSGAGLAYSEFTT